MGKKLQAILGKDAIQQLSEWLETLESEVRKIIGAQGQRAWEAAAGSPTAEPHSALNVSLAFSSGCFPV